MEEISRMLEALERLGAFMSGSALQLPLVADSVAALAAFALPSGLLYLALRRRDIEHRGLLVLLALTLLAWGLNHALGAVALLQAPPERIWIDGAKGTVAALALLTAVVFWSLFPALLRLPSARSLRRTNAGLAQEASRQQQALRETEERLALYRALFDKCESGLALVTPDGEWIAANGALAAQLGVSDPLRQPPAALFGAPLLDPDHPSRSEERARQGDEGEQRWIETRTTLLCDRQGRPQALLLQTRDLTPEKRVAQLRAEGERQAAERNAQIASLAAQLEAEQGERQAIEAEAARFARLLVQANGRMEQLERQVARVIGETGGESRGTR